MLLKTITTDYIVAMKARESLKASTLNLLRAQLKNVMIEARTQELSDTEVIAVIKKQVKQRQDSITQYTQGGRQELADKEQAELEILKVYLPPEMSEGELVPIVNEAIEEVGAAGMKDMGSVMKAIMLKVAGKADNALVSQLVKKALGDL